MSTRRRHGASHARHSGLPAAAPRRSRGFSMVEVLVSMVIIAVGMLGLAKIQALSYASTGIAGQQSIAAIQASSLASAMHANRNYWSAVTTPFSFQAVGLQPPTSTDAALTGGTAGCAAACTPALVAAYDLTTWVTTVNGVLANPTSTITCPVGGACTIQISWSESNVAINAQSTGTTMATPAYTLYVVP